MSTMQRLSLIGLYNYNNTLFDNLSLPAGYDKQTFIDTLLVEHGEKCVLYPDFNFMKYSFGVISKKWQLELKRIYEALTAEYDPTWNYDRHEEYTDETTDKYKDTATSDYRNKTTSDNSTTSSQSVDSSNERKKAAYNSGTYEADEKTTSNDGTKTVHHDGTDANNEGDTNNKVNHDGSSKTTHKAHLYGNIGVTTATQMINEVLDQRISRNLYALACEIFANELLIGIY